MAQHKRGSKIPLKVRALPVRLATVRAQIDDDLGAGLRLALRRATKHQPKRLPSAVEEELLREALSAVGLVLDDWLDWGDP
ncbi:MAG: hypothetical protein AMXMBFR56_82600 [Polyangiaceae bacterium]